MVHVAVRSRGAISRSGMLGHVSLRSLRLSLAVTDRPCAGADAANASGAERAVRTMPGGFKFASESASGFRCMLLVSLPV